MSSVNRNYLTSFFPILMPFVSFPCLLALARPVSIMLKRSGESEHHFLVPDLGGKSFHPFITDYISCGLLYNVEMCSLYT